MKAWPGVTRIAEAPSNPARLPRGASQATLELPTDDRKTQAPRVQRTEKPRGLKAFRPLAMRLAGTRCAPAKVSSLGHARVR